MVLITNPTVFSNELVWPADSCTIKYANDRKAVHKQPGSFVVWLCTLGARRTSWEDNKKTQKTDFYLQSEIFAKYAAPSNLRKVLLLWATLSVNCHCPPVFRNISSWDMRRRAEANAPLKDRNLIFFLQPEQIWTRLCGCCSATRPHTTPHAHSAAIRQHSRGASNASKSTNQNDHLMFQYLHWTVNRSAVCGCFGNSIGLSATVSSPAPTCPGPSGPPGSAVSAAHVNKYHTLRPILLSTHDCGDCGHLLNLPAGRLNVLKFSYFGYWLKQSIQADR